jgi:hypothetical protein
MKLTDAPSLSTSWKTPRTANKEDIIDLLGRLEQDNPQYTADEMIAKVVTHQKALQTLLLSISRAVILLGNLSQTLLKSVRNQIKYQLIMG